MAASWLADAPREGLQQARDTLLDARDALHLTTGRATDRLALQDQDQVAEALGLLDADTLLRRVYEAAGAVSYASDVTWREVERVLRPRTASPRGARLRGGCWAAADAPRSAPRANPRRSGPRWPRASWSTRARRRWPCTRGPTAIPCCRCAPRRRRHRPASRSRCPRSASSRAPHRTFPCRGPPRPARSSSPSSVPGRPPSRCGRPWTRPVSSPACCPTGSGSAAAPSATPCTASPSTGTWSRPPYGRRRLPAACTAPICC
ncbi:hypothetical protein IHE61_29355 [Streptomyces sp. GKU 257-1]|nr:hypothetical protein [Streptomyces sp. GKU 257-1]